MGRQRRGWRQRRSSWTLDKRPGRRRGRPGGLPLGRGRRRENLQRNQHAAHDRQDEDAHADDEGEGHPPPAPGHQVGLALRSPSVFAPPLSKDGSGLTAGNSRLNSWERPEGPACSTIPGRPEGPAADVTSNEAPAAPGAAADPAGGTYGARSEEACVRGRTAGSGGGVSGSAEPAPAPSLRPQRPALAPRGVFRVNRCAASVSRKTSDVRFRSSSSSLAMREREDSGR